MQDNPQILYEDPHLFVINKPAGWVVNDAITVGETPVLQRWLEKKPYQLAKNKELRSGIVHRLDKETSGVLVIAKTETFFFALQALFKERKVQKTYIALVHGRVKTSKGTITANVGRLPWRRERFGVLPGGRDARTDYAVERVYRKGTEFLSLVQFEPHTGRTHQIRIHAKYLGNPIVADSFYAGRKTARKDRLWCPRLFLHASRIQFEEPETHARIAITAPLPDELHGALSQLEKLPQTA